MIFVLTNDLHSMPLVIVNCDTIQEVLEQLNMWHPDGILPDGEKHAVLRAFEDAVPPNDSLLGTACATCTACGMTLTVQRDDDSYIAWQRDKEDVEQGLEDALQKQEEPKARMYRPASAFTPVPSKADTKLYPLTEDELHEAEANTGYGEHCHWSNIECTGVHIDRGGFAVAVYQFNYYDTNEGETAVGTLYVTVRDGKRYADY